MNETQQSVITTHGNSSLFTVYSKVRQAVFTQAIREATRLYHLANTATDSDSDSDEDGEDKGKEQQIKIPKVIIIMKTVYSCFTAQWWLIFKFFFW